MGVTDVVIELAPVNKKKNLIMYAIMGVFALTTILFLILFIVKPAATIGGISELELTSNLYSNNGKLVAVKDGTYTIVANVKYTGDDTDASIKWVYDENLISKVTPTQAGDNAATAVHNSQVTKVEGEVDPSLGTKIHTEYFTFRPKSEATGPLQASVTAKTNALDKNTQQPVATSSIAIEIDEYGASELEFSTLTATGRTPIPILENKDGEGYVVNIPYDENAKTQPDYTVNLKQIPFTDAFGQKAVISNIPTANAYGNSVYMTNSLFLEYDEQGAVSIGAINGYNPKYAEFFKLTPNKIDSSVIKITYNKFNSSETKTVKLTVNVRSASALNVVSKYSFLPNTTIDSAAETPPSSAGADTEIELYTGSSSLYDLSSHILVTPWTRKSDWLDKCNFISDNNAIVSCDTQKGLRLRTNNVPGETKVRIVDTSSNSIGTTLELTVKVRRGITKFGFGNATDPARSEFSQSLDLRANKGSSGNSITVAYHVPANEEKIDVASMNPDLKVEAPAGITFAGVDAKTGLLKLAATFGNKANASTALLTANLTFSVAENISSSAVNVKITPVGTSSSSVVPITVNITPVVEATDITFIDATAWTALVSKHNKDPLLAYSAYTVGEGGDANIKLNMKNDVVYTVPFALSDILKVTDKYGNIASFNGVEISLQNNTNVFRLTEMAMTGKIIPHNSQDLIQRIGSITFFLNKGKANEKRRTLSVEIIDTPLQFKITDNPSFFRYGYPTTNDIDKCKVTDQVVPGDGNIKRMYASGYERVNKDTYSYAVSVNDDRNSFLFPVDPTNKYGSFVYYCASEDIAEYLEGLLTESPTADDISAFAAKANSVAMFAVTRYSESRNVYYLQDFYKIVQYNASTHTGWAKDGWTKITSFNVAVCPYDMTTNIISDYNNQYTSAFFSIRPVRLIDEIVIKKGGNILNGGNRAYTDTASGSSRYAVTLHANLSMGTIGGEAKYYLVDYDNGNDVNLEKIEFIGAETVPGDSQVTKITDTSFTMPDATAGPVTATIKYTTYSKRDTNEVRVDIRVENRTLKIKEIKLYKEDGKTPYTDGENVFLNVCAGASVKVKWEVVYYSKDDAEGGAAANFLFFQGFKFNYHSGDVACYETEDNKTPMSTLNEDKSIPEIKMGETDIERTFRGEVLLHGKNPNISECKFSISSLPEKAPGEIFSPHISFTIYTAAKSFSMKDDGYSSENKTVIPVNFTITGAQDTGSLTGANSSPVKTWVLEPAYDSIYKSVAGNTKFDAKVENVNVPDAGRICESSQVSSNPNALYSWEYDESADKLIIKALGKVNYTPLNIKVVITEYVTTANGVKVDASGATNTEHVVLLGLTTTADVFKVQLKIDGTEDSIYNITTHGNNTVVKKELTSLVNNDEANFAPNPLPAVSYKLEKQVKDGGAFSFVPSRTSVDMTGAEKLYLLEEGGKTYLVWRDDTLSFDGAYRLIAYVGSVESASTSITLNTTVKHLELVFVTLGGATLDINAAKNAVKITDISKSFIVNGKVVNSGTSTQSGSVSYKIVNDDGTDYTGAKVSVNTSGAVTFNEGGSYSFKVRILCDALSPIDILVSVDNAVDKIKTKFGGSSWNTDATDTIERIYSTETQTINLNDCVSLENMGKDGKAPYAGATVSYEYNSNSVFEINDTTKVLSFKGVGTAEFKIKVIGEKGTQTYIEKVITVRTISPIIAATLQLGSGTKNAEQSVNLMDISSDTEFTLDVKDASGKSYNITNVNLTGTEVGNDKLFTFVAATKKLTLVYNKASTMDFSAEQIYTFTVTAKSNNHTSVPCTVTVKVRAALTDNLLKHKMFAVFEGSTEVTSGYLVKGKTYTIKALDAYSSYNLSFHSDKTFAAIASGNTIMPTDIGTVSFTATFVKFGHTFDAGAVENSATKSIVFAVTNDIGSVSGKLCSDSAGNTELSSSKASDTAADYTTDTDKKKVYYVFDYSATGETFAAGDFTLTVGGVFTLVPGDPVFNNTAKKAVWTLLVNDAGEGTAFAVARKANRYYAAETKSFTFTMNLKPTSLEIADISNVNPTAASGTFAPTVKQDGAAYTRTDYSVAYELVDGVDFLTLNGDTYTGKLTESGGSATVKATLTVNSGKYKGLTIVKNFKVTIIGIKKTTVTVKESEKTEFFLKMGESVNLADKVTVTRDSNNPAETQGTWTNNSSSMNFSNSNNTLTVKAPDTNSPDLNKTYSKHMVTLSVPLKNGVWNEIETTPRTITFTIHILPTATMHDSYLGVDKGGSVALSFNSVTIDSVSVPVYAEYKITKDNDAPVTTSTLGKIDGSVFTGLSGGKVEITATPYIGSGAFAGKELKPVAFTVYVRELRLKSGTTLSLPSDGSLTLTADMFDILGYNGTGAATVNNVVAVTSGVIDINTSTKTINTASHINAYLDGTTPVPENKTATISVTLKKDEKNFIGEFTVSVTPVPFAVTAEYKVVTPFGTETPLTGNSLKVGDKLVAKLTLVDKATGYLANKAPGYTSTSIEKVLLQGTGTSSISGTVVTYEFTPTSTTNDGTLKFNITFANGATYAYTLEKLKVTERTAAAIDSFTYPVTGGYVANNATPTYTGSVETDKTTVTGAVTYAIVAGGEFASVNSSTGVITLIDSAIDGNFTVEMTWTGSGEYAGKVLKAQCHLKKQAAASPVVSLAYSSTMPTVTIQNLAANMYSTNFEIIGGNDYASIDSSGKLTVTKYAEIAVAVTVKLTVTVNSGVFASKTYTATAVYTIAAVTPPTITFNYNNGTTPNFSVDDHIADRNETVTKTFAVVSGSEYATIAPSTGVLTSLQHKEVDVYVTVKVTVTMTSGAFNGKSYEAIAVYKVAKLTAPSITAFNYGTTGSPSLTPTLTVATLNSSDYTATYSIINGGEYASVNNSGVLTVTKHAKTAVTVTVQVTVKVTKDAGFKDKEYIATANYVVAAATAPAAFTVTKKSGSTDKKSYTATADYTVQAYVISGNASVNVTGSDITITYNAGGEVTLLFVGTYNKDGSPYKGDKSTCELSITPTETYYTEVSAEKFTMNYNADPITVTGNLTGVKSYEISGIAVKNSDGSTITVTTNIASDKHSATITYNNDLLTALYAGNVSVEVTVKLSSNYYNYDTNGYKCTLTIPRLTHNSADGKNFTMKLPEFMTASGAGYNLSDASFVAVNASKAEESSVVVHPTYNSTNKEISFNFTNSTGANITISSVKVTVTKSGSSYTFFVYFNNSVTVPHTAT